MFEQSAETAHLNFATIKEDFQAFSSALMGLPSDASGRLEQVNRAWEHFETQLQKLDAAGNHATAELHERYEDAGDRFSDAVSAYKNG